MNHPEKPMAHRRRRPAPDPRQASLVEPTHDDPRTRVGSATTHIGGLGRTAPATKAIAPRTAVVITGWHVQPRWYAIVLRRGEGLLQERRNQRATTLAEARAIAAIAIVDHGWDRAWIFPSQT